MEIPTPEYSAREKLRNPFGNDELIASVRVSEASKSYRILFF